MKKKILSLLTAAVILFGIIPAYAVDEAELTIFEQSFVGLSDIPDGWTFDGTKDTHYSLGSDSVATAPKKGAFVKAYHSKAFDTGREAYEVTFNIAHYSRGLSYVHIGTDEAGAISDAAATSGYSIQFNTTDFKLADIKLFKNGKEIGTLPDGGGNWHYHQKLREFRFSVTEDSIQLSGAENTITIEDDEPIYSGYVGFVLKDSNDKGWSKLSYLKLNKLLDVSGHNISGTHGIADDIEVDFTYPLDTATVNQTNVYVADEVGNALPKSDYSVSCDGSRIKISFNVNLAYTTNYQVVIGKGLYIDGTSIGMASQYKIPFTTEDPPFYIRCTGDGNTLGIKIGNTIYEPQNFKVFIKATDENGVEIGSWAYPVAMPEMGKTLELSETVEEDLTSAQLESFAVAEDNTPLLDDFFKLDTENGTTIADIYANRLTEEAKTSVSEIMADGEYTDIDVLYLDFAKAVVVAAINGWNESGYRHIDEIFDENGEFIGLVLDEYNGAVDPSDMNEYIYNYGIESFEDIQKAVDEAVLSTDQAYYTHTFTTADAEGCEWDIYVEDVLDNTLTKNTKGVVFSDTSGIYIPKVATVNAISKFDVSGDYELSGAFSRAFNDLIYYFSYIDSQNWCRVMFSYSNDTKQSTTIARSVNGTVTTYATYNNGNAKEKKVIVEEDGYVTVKNNSDEIIIDRTYVGGSLETGKIGIGLKYAEGYIRTVNILTYLKGEADVSSENVPIETEKVNVQFNFHIKPETATKDNISISENGKRITDYTIAANDDGTGFDIIFGNKLKYKSSYDISISEDVKVGFGKATLLGTQTINFITIKPEFDVSAFYGKSGETDVFVNNMRTVNEVYSASQKITDFADKDITVTLVAENSSEAPDNALVVFELTNENGKALYNSGLIPVSIADGLSSDVSKTVHIPADVTENSKFSYFVFDTEEVLHTKYPFIGTVAIGDGEIPNISKNGSFVKIWGSTLSKSADKNINLLLKSETNGEVIKTASTITDEGGNYNFEFELNTDLMAQSDYVNVFISGEEFKKAVTEEIYVANADDRNNAVKDINSRKDTSQAIEDNAEILDILAANKYGVELYKNLDTAELLQLASMVDKYKPYNETDGGTQFLKKIQEYMVIIHYNSGNSELLYSSDGKFMTDDIIDFAVIPATGNMYKIYEENLKDVGKSMVRNGILNKNCSTVDELCKLFAQNVVTYGVNNWNKNGYGHIYSLLTENAGVCSLDVTKYVNASNRTKFEQSLLDNPVSSFTDLQSRINGISSGSGSGTGGGSGNGGSGSGSSGWGASSGSSVKGGYGTASETIGTDVRNNFDDLAGYEWAENAVEYLAESGVVSGYEDDTFRPANEITREEFITLVTKAFSLSAGPETLEKFSDVSEEAWYAQYIKAAQSNKIVAGYNGIFGVGSPLTRQDAVVILERVLGIKGYDIGNDEDLAAGYSDADEIADYAYDAFNKFVGNGIIKGLGDNRLAPGANCKRAEMAVMLYNVLMRYNEE